MDVNQFFELGKQYWPFAIPIILAIGNAIPWYFSIQKLRAEREKTRVETQKMRLEIRKLEAEQLQLESLRKGETSYQPSETTSKREFPKLLKANWTTTANIGFALLAIILFCVDWFTTLPLTAHGLTLMVFLLFGALLNLLIVGFQVLQRQMENNSRIQNWISFEGQFINLELAKIHHAANVELTKNHHAANVELTKTTLDLIARVGDEIIDHINKVRESPGNHPSQTANPVKPE
jgi:hypothetical protein